MSVYKEGFHALTLIENRSKQIWNDACDYGAVTRKGDDLWNWARQLVDQYGVEGSRTVATYPTGCTVTHEVSLMDEWSTGDTMFWRITYVASDHMRVNGQLYDGYFYAVPLPDRRIAGNRRMDD